MKTSQNRISDEHSGPGRSFSRATIATEADISTYRKRLPDASQRIRLKRGLSVSPFCIGAVRDPKTIAASFDLGVNFFFFTADMHWPYYEGTRRGLTALLRRSPSVRDRIVVAVASYVTQPEFCQAPFEEAIHAVPGLGHIDVTVAGGSYRSDFGVRAKQYARHDSLGARAFGASFHDRRMATDAINERLVDVAFARYNPTHRGAETEVFRHLRRRPRAPLFNFTSTRGYLEPSRYQQLGIPSTFWRPSITDYYRFAMTLAPVDGILCAPRTPKQVRELTRAMEMGPLSEEERTYICDLADLSTGRKRLTAHSNEPSARHLGRVAGR